MIPHSVILFFALKNLGAQVCYYRVYSMKTRKTKHGYCFTAQNKKDSEGLLRLMNVLAGKSCEEDPEIPEHKDKIQKDYS